MQKARKFASLRTLARNPRLNLREAAALAFESVSAMPHGDAIREWLASILCETGAPETEGAWREQSARRKFADEILQMMDGERHERDEDGGRDDGNQGG